MKAVSVDYSRLTKEGMRDFKKERPQRKHVSVMIDEESEVFLDGERIAVYKKAEFSTLDLLKVCNSLEFSPYTRTGGLTTNTINLGNTSRNPLRENRCSPAKLAFNAPCKHEILVEYAKRVSNHYRTFFPRQFAAQVKQTHVGPRRVLADYRLPGTPFTSGVVNKDCPMNYHFDQANTRDGMSCMLILKGNVTGGELILPELNIGFDCQDDYMLLFDGQKYLHGVTNIIKGEGGYRYSVVYYNNNRMHICLPPQEELEFYQNWLEKTSN